MALLETPLPITPGLGEDWQFPRLDRYTGKPMPNCSRPVNYGVKASTLSIEFDSGHSQRRVKAPPKKTFEFQYNALSLTEYRTIRDFFMLVLNCQSFMWTDPVEKTPYRVLFAQDTFSAINKGHGPAGPYYELPLKLVQTWS